MAFLNVKYFFFHHSFYAPFGYNIFYGLENFIPPHSSRALIKEQPQRAARDIVVGVSRPWDAQPHIFMARGLAAFSRMFVQFFISALLASSMKGRRLLVSPASSLSYCSSMSKSYFPKSAPGGLLAFGFALRELALCPARYRTERPRGLARHTQGW